MGSGILFVVLAITILCAEGFGFSASKFNKVPNRRLIEFNETYRTWMTLPEVEELSKECGNAGQHGGFMDITDHPNLSPLGLSEEIRQKLQAIGFPPQVTHQAEVQLFNSHLKTNKLEEFDAVLSAFKTRKYNTEDGKKAAHHIRDLFLKHSVGRSDVSVQLFEHTWTQPSVIARMQGHGPNADEVVIISSHEDSISSSTDAPGADDDASGTSCVLEVFRVLCEHGFVPDRTVEFHTYSAEEVGLWGSQAIASSYQAKGIPVYAEMQLDMTMFVKQGTVETFGIITDYVSTDLTEFLKKLVTAYSILGYTTSKCGYACSDHASWTKAGYASCFPFEGTMANSDPYIHSKNDLLTYLNVLHGMEFAKVATGFIIELASN